MSGKRMAVALVALMITAGCVTVPGAVADKGHGKKHHAKKHNKHHKKKPKPTPTPATTSAAQSISVDATAGPFHIETQAQRAANTPATGATGYFTGTLAPIGNFQGHVTCLSVVGNEIGLFYPIEKSEPPGLETLGAGVFITVVTDGMGHATMVGFLPTPQKTTDSCEPGANAPALMPATGIATTTGGS